MVLRGNKPLQALCAGNLSGGLAQSDLYLFRIFSHPLLSGLALLASIAGLANQGAENCNFRSGSVPA